MLLDPRQLLLSFVLATCGASIGCGGTGSASIDGDIGGYGFDLNTVFSWIDAKERDNDNGRTFYRDREFTVLNVVMSGASFDPTVDNRFLSGTDKVDLANEDALGGNIRLQITTYENVRDNDQLSFPPEASSADQALLIVDFSFGAQELDGDAEYPNEVARFGTDFSATLTLSEAGQEVGASTGGTLTLSVERSDNDPGNALVGSITVEFDAPIINERIAECNASGGNAACEVERPPQT